MSATANLSLYEYPPKPEAPDAPAPAPVLSTEARLAAVEAQLQELWAIMRYTNHPTRLPHDTEQFVTLDQCAAMVRRSKRTLEHYRERMPDADIQGGGGRASMWAWAKIRPWLAKEFGVPLPEQYPY